MGSRSAHGLMDLTASLRNLVKECCGDFLGFNGGSAAWVDLQLRAKCRQFEAGGSTENSVSIMPGLERWGARLEVEEIREKERQSTDLSSREEEEVRITIVVRNREGGSKSFPELEMASSEDWILLFPSGDEKEWLEQRYGFIPAPQYRQSYGGNESSGGALYCSFVGGVSQ